MFLAGPSEHHAFVVAVGFDEAAVLAAAREHARAHGMEESIETPEIVASQGGNVAIGKLRNWWGDDGESMRMEPHLAIGNAIDAVATLAEGT
jgi:hypothetical protein